MAQAWASLKAFGREVQPLVVAWLVVALLLPSILGLVPSAKANTADGLQQAATLELCAKLGHLPDDQGKAPPNHDCPCCMPSAAGHVTLPPLDIALVPASAWHVETLVLAAFDLRRLAGHPHHLAPARAPPVSIFA